jgi:hypothetical protein
MYLTTDGKFVANGHREGAIYFPSMMELLLKLFAVDKYYFINNEVISKCISREHSNYLGDNKWTDC